MMKKRSIVTSLALSAGLAGTALAGARYAYPVSIDKTSRHAHGSMGSARNSTDATQFLTCWSVAGVAICEAMDAAATVVSCSTYDPELIALARSVKDDSFVDFYWNASGVCTNVLVNNASYFEPRKP